MARQSIRIIEIPMELPQQGEEPGELAARCARIAHYLTRIRIPEALHGLALWVSPRLRQGEGGLRLDLHLVHDGQLPLEFRGPRGRGHAPAFTRELDRLAGCIEAALAESNNIWLTAAEIVNSDDAPAGEVEHLRKMSGYMAPARPPKSPSGGALNIVARQRELTLESPAVRPEYLESEPVLIVADCRVNSGRIQMSASAVRPAHSEQLLSTRVAVGHALNVRWPDEDTAPWVACTALASIVGVQPSLVGHAVVSNETLKGKAIQVDVIENASLIVDEILKLLAPVLDAEHAFKQRAAKATKL